MYIEKIRNTLRFMLGNINDFNPETDSIAETNLLEVDRYLLNRLREFTASTINNYENFDYLNIYQEVQNFINVELSNFYLDYGKDILYIEKKILINVVACKPFYIKYLLT